MSKIRLGPDGIHIFSRDSGLNILLDEDIPPSDVWTSCPRQVSIALTNACDLECSHCYAPKTPARLNLETVKQWMVELDNAGCLSVGFGGGEPTIYPYLEELCRFGQNNTALAITMTTHGHRLSASLVKQLKESVNFLRISMDGVEQTYEKMRGRLFSNLMESIDIVSGQIPFGINYVVNEATISELPSAVDIAEAYKAAEILFLPEQAYGRGTAVNKRTLEQLSDWINSYTGTLQLAISSTHRELVQFQPPLPHETDQLSFVHISAKGILQRSSFAESGQLIGAKGVMHAFNELAKMESIV